MNIKEFSIAVRAFRKLLNLSQEEMAKQLGVSQSGYQKWESGDLKRGPSVGVLATFQKVNPQLFDQCFGRDNRIIDLDDSPQQAEELDRIVRASYIPETSPLAMKIKELATMRQREARYLTQIIMELSPEQRKKVEQMLLDMINESLWREEDQYSPRQK